MKDFANIKLKYFRTLREETQWFILYEFEINKADFFDKSDKGIIQELLQTRVLNEIIYHPEMDKSDIELSKEALKNGVQRPYEFSKLELDDFEYINGLNEFKDWLLKFKTEGWEEDIADAQILIEKTETEIFNRTKIENGIWLLSKEKFVEKSNKLIETHWMYLHFETFIEIDRTNRIVRTFDYGYD